MEVTNTPHLLIEEMSDNHWDDSPTQCPLPDDPNRRALRCLLRTDRQQYRTRATIRKQNRAAPDTTIVRRASNPRIERQAEPQLLSDARRSHAEHVGRLNDVYDIDELSDNGTDDSPIITKTTIFDGNQDILAAMGFFYRKCVSIFDKL